MRILFDAYWWQSGPPSGKAVVREVVSAWVHEFPDDEIYLMVASTDRVKVHNYVIRHGLQGVVVEAAPRWAVLHPLSLLNRRYRSREFDVVITQNFGVPNARAVVGTFVHDAIFVSHPQWFTWLERLYLSLIRPSLRFANVVMTSSASEKSRFVDCWPEVSSRLHAVGLAAPTGLLNATAITVPVIRELQRPFLLTVGRFNVRKNLGLLLEAYATSEAVDKYDFVVVGPSDGKRPKLSGLVEGLVGRKIHLLGGVREGQLRWLYERASIFILASLDEGFGLPLLEAVSFGLPVLASGIPAFRELGVVSAFFDPTSLDSVRRAIELGPGVRRSNPISGKYSWSSVVHKMRSGLVPG